MAVLSCATQTHILSALCIGHGKYLRGLDWDLSS